MPNLVAVPLISCRVAELDFTVTPLQLHTPTNDITAGPALDRDKVLAAMNAGADAIADRCDYLIVGDMGIGNTTAAAARQQPFDDHAVALLAAFGGHELAAIAGAVLAARARSIPVMLDGLSTAAALSAQGQLDILDHAMIAHMSPEPGNLRLAVALRKVPIIDLKMRLGEASGAAVATLLVRAACALHYGMTTFGEAGVNRNNTL